MVLKRLLQLSLVLTFTVILLGAYTRLADAGLGCPDWPGCYGQIGVPNTDSELAQARELYPGLTVEADKAWLEMIHRYFAGSLGLLVFVISTLALAQRKGGRILPVAISVVVIFQALLGMWTVTMMLMPVIVMGHLLGGFTLFCLLALLYWRVNARTLIVPQYNVGAAGRSLAFVALVAVVGQIALGGWTSSNYAALMCTELPICQGDWKQYLDFPTAFQLIQPERDSYEFGTLDYGARMTIHVSHRIGAMFVTALLLTLVVYLVKRGSYQYRKQAFLLTVLLALQIALGISNVMFGLPLAVAVAHNLVAALLLVNILYVNHLLWRTSRLGQNVNTDLMGKEAYYE